MRSNTFISKMSWFRISYIKLFGWLDLLLLHSRSVSALPCWSLASIDFNGADLNSFFLFFDTRWSLDKCCDYVPPTDAQRLWGWMEEWAGLDSGLLRDDWRVCRKTASPFDWQRFCTIKVADTEAIRAQSHRGFCKCSRKTNYCNLFLGICLVKLLVNFHHTFHTIIHHIPCFSST